MTIDQRLQGKIVVRIVTSEGKRKLFWQNVYVGMLSRIRGHYERR